MPEIIEDPDCEGFDGCYVLNIKEDPPDYNYTLLLRYLKNNNKKVQDLTKDELEQFRFK